MNYKAIQKWCSKLPPKQNVFEFGAMDGKFTETISRWCGEWDRYFMFEPNPNNRARCLINKPDRVEFEDRAIWNSTGRNLFWISKSNSRRPYDGQSSLREPEPRGEYSFTERYIDTITLDDFCNEQCVRDIGFIWCDIQGAEADLIAGGGKMIPRTKLMLLEIMKKPHYKGALVGDELIEYVEYHGFDIVCEMDYDILFKNQKWEV